MEKITRYYESRGVALGELRLVKGVRKADLAGTITLAPPSATSDVWTRRFPDPVTAFASGWMRGRARARQAATQFPLPIPDLCTRPRPLVQTRKAGADPRADSRAHRSRAVRRVV